MHQNDMAALGPLGWDLRRGSEFDALGRTGLTPARVGRVDRGGAVAITAGGRVRVEGDGLVAGDWVAVADGRIAAVLERRTLISRRAAGRADAAQPIAANVDVVVVVQGLDRPLRDRRLHRALALAWDSGATPVIALTKADLDEGANARGAATEAALGVDAHVVSVRTGEGLGAIAALASPGRTLVLIGESGAGKSSLVNALVGAQMQATRDVRDGDAKGRHTTTARHLVPLPGGGALIDTPGVRELGLWGSEEGVATVFSDITELAGGCRFRDCRHDGEPGCAVARAVEEGRLDAARLESLHDLTRETEALALRADEREWRAHGRRFSRVAREASRLKRR